MQPVFSRLEQLGITPDLKATEPSPSSPIDPLIQTVIRRAQELRNSWKLKEPAVDNSANSDLHRGAHSNATRQLLHDRDEVAKTSDVRSHPETIHATSELYSKGLATNQSGTAQPKASALQEIALDDADDERAEEELKRLQNEEAVETPRSRLASEAPRLLRPAIPYRHWMTKPLPDPRSSPEDRIIAGLVDIIGAEGPMPCHRAYRIYASAVGIMEPNRQVRRVFNRAVAKALRTGLIEQCNEYGTDDQINKIVRLKGTPEAVLRTGGNRSFFEVPPSEIGLMMNSLRHEYPVLTDQLLIDAIQSHFGIKNMAQSIRERLFQIKTQYTPQ